MRNKFGLLLAVGLVSVLFFALIVYNNEEENYQFIKLDNFPSAVVSQNISGEDYITLDNDVKTLEDGGAIEDYSDDDESEEETKLSTELAELTKRLADIAMDYYELGYEKGLEDGSDMCEENSNSVDGIHNLDTFEI